MKSLSCFLFLLIGFNATAQLSGVYTIDSSKPATATNYKSIKAALDSLNKSGISNHTTFKLADGIYTDSIELDSARLKFPHFKYHIIFTSISGDSGKVTITSKDGPALLLYNTNNIYFKSIGFHSGSKYYSVFITNSDSIFFENCLITGVTATSRVMVFANFEYVNNAYLSVSHCMIANGIEGVHAEFISPNYSGIDNFKVSPKLNISYCNFNNLSKYDIYSYRINNNISDNIVHEIRIEGYHLNANGKSILLRNHFSGNINLYGLDSTVFINNVLNKNLIAMEAEVIIFHNTILGSVTESSTYQGGTYEPYIHGANNIILGMLNDDPGTHYGCYEVSFKQLRNSCFSTLSKYDCNTVNHDNRLNIYRWINETNDTTSIVDSPLFISKSDFHIMNDGILKIVLLQLLKALLIFLIKEVIIMWA
ncbi:MAG: hypothetical protein NTX03_08290 [Bacteroidetes bacterium]|nr:hypothetical protein [Bacteroidota bacterium]